MSIIFEGNNTRVFGTFPLRGDAAVRAVKDALQAGYRSIDTAQMYANEAEVGTAIKECGVPREEICVTTKVSTGNFSEDRFIPSVEQSLKELQVDSADLLLLHWPDPEGKDNKPMLRLLEKAHRDGLAKNVGISNYTAAMMLEAVETVGVPIDCNQVEFHPLLDQSVLLAAAAETGVPLTAYCSVARGAVFKHPEFAEIGEGHGKSAAQVVLRWIFQMGVAPITMSTKPENMAANFDIMDFELSDGEMDRITALNATNLRVVGKDLVPFAPDWD